MKMGMMKWMVLGAFVLAAGTASAVLFTGSNTVNNLFSETNNWDAFPATGDLINIAANGTSISNPAVIDSAFNTDVG